MKLRRGKPRYTIPAHSSIVGVYIEGNQKHNQMCSYVLYQVTLEDVRQTSILGMPNHYAIENDSIIFDPAPDKSYLVKVRYTPPIAEF